MRAVSNPNLTTLILETLSTRQLEQDRLNQRGTMLIRH